MQAGTADTSSRIPWSIPQLPQLSLLQSLGPLLSTLCEERVSAHLSLLTISGVDLGDRHGILC